MQAEDPSSEPGSAGAGSDGTGAGGPSPPGGAWEDVGDAADVAVGTLRRVMVGATAIAVGRTDAGYFALVDACPHAGAPLSAGAIRGEHLVCSWHGWKFECATGVCPLFPGAPSATHRDVRVEGGRVLVAR